MNEKQKKELIRQLSEGTHHWYKCTSCEDIFGSETTIDGEKCSSCGEGVLLRNREATERYYAQHIDHAMMWGSEHTDFHRRIRKDMGKDFPIHGGTAAAECWYCVNGQEP